MNLYMSKRSLRNQWEWCFNYYPNHQTISDPLFNTKLEPTFPDKVVKGGSWCTPTFFLTSN